MFFKLNSKNDKNKIENIYFFDTNILSLTPKIDAKEKIYKLSIKPEPNLNCGIIKNQIKILIKQENIKYLLIFFSLPKISFLLKENKKIIKKIKVKIPKNSITL